MNIQWDFAWAIRPTFFFFFFSILLYYKQDHVFPKFHINAHVSGFKRKPYANRFAAFCRRHSINFYINTYKKNIYICMLSQQTTYFSLAAFNLFHVDLFYLVLFSKQPIFIIILCATPPRKPLTLMLQNLFLQYLRLILFNTSLTYNHPTELLIHRSFVLRHTFASVCLHLL